MQRKRFRIAVLTALSDREWTQRRLALEMGISEQRISDFLTAKTDSTEVAIRICRKLGLPVEYAERTCGISESVEVPK